MMYKSLLAALLLSTAAVPAFAQNLPAPVLPLAGTEVVPCIQPPPGTSGAGYKGCPVATIAQAAGIVAIPATICNGTADATATISAAIIAENAAGGGSVWLPATGHLCKTSTTINMLPGVTLRGYGYGTFVLPGSGISYSGTGDAIASIQAINSDTNVSNGVRDIQVVCTNGSNVGGGYDDVGGTFVTLDHLRVLGCGYDVIFDQTEVASIIHSDLETAKIANLWLLNDGEHTPGADAGFTNNILVEDTEFNSASTTVPLIVDDGGYAHSYVKNNLNGGGVSFACANCMGLDFRTNELESATSTNMTFSNLTFFAGTSVGSGSGINITGGNQITPTAGNHAVALVSVGSISITGNSIGNTTASRIAVTSAFSLTLNSNHISGGYSNELSGTPTNLYNLDGGAAVINFSTLEVGGKPLCSATAPVIASGFGTTPTLLFAGSTCAFQIQIGSGGTATFGVLTLPAATNANYCSFSDKTTTSSTVYMTKQVGTASATSVTIENFNTSGVAAAWTAGDILIGGCLSM